MPINLPNYADDEEERNLEAKYKALKKILLKNYDPSSLEKLIMKKVIPVFKAVVKENASKMGKPVLAIAKFNFSTFTVSKAVYDRYYEINDKYSEKYFAGKARYFNEFIIKSGCENLFKLKGKVIGKPIKNKIHLKLWFYDFISDRLKEVRDKVVSGNIFQTARINEKKIMCNDLLINTGLDCVLGLGKKRKFE